MWAIQRNLGHPAHHLLNGVLWFLHPYVLIILSFRNGKTSGLDYLLNTQVLIQEQTSEVLTAQLGSSGWGTRASPEHPRCPPRPASVCGCFSPSQLLQGGVNCVYRTKSIICSIFKQLFCGLALCRALLKVSLVSCVRFWSSCCG